MTFLPQSDVVRLTKKRRFRAQCRALERLGYTYTLADDGEPLVRADALDGQGKAARNRGPRWDLLNRV